MWYLSKSSFTHMNSKSSVDIWSGRSRLEGRNRSLSACSIVGSIKCTSGGQRAQLKTTFEKKDELTWEVIQNPGWLGYIGSYILPVMYREYIQKAIVRMPITLRFGSNDLCPCPFVPRSVGWNRRNLPAWLVSTLIFGRQNVDSWDPVLIMELGWRFHPVLQGQESLKAPFVYLKRTRLKDLGDVGSAKETHVAWKSSRMTIQTESGDVSHF